MDSLGVFGFIALAVGVVWAVLGFPIPFMIWSIMESNKENGRYLRQIISELRGVE